MYYKSGVYVPNSPVFLGWHAIKIIGWGVESGLQHWIAVNSWGGSWGHKGTFKILRGNNTCYIESFVAAGKPNSELLSKI